MAETMLVNVLILSKDAKQGELYARECRELVDCHVDLMSNVDSALGWLGKLRYHVVVLDLNQPLYTLERIKRIHPESSVIVLASNPTIEDAVRAIRLGAEDFLKKPISMESFKLAVQRGLNRKVLFDEDNVYSKSLNLVNCCQMISASLEETRILSIVKSYVGRELQCIHSGVFTMDKEGRLKIEDPDQSLDQGLEEIFSITLAPYDVSELFPSRDVNFHFIEKSERGSSIFFLRFIGVDDKDYFFIALSGRRPEPFGEFESRLKILSAQVDVTTKNIMRYRDVQRMAFVDDLTGLHNTRYLNHVLDRELEKARSQNIPLAILFIDADRFKNVNDSHGHLHGSKLLGEIAQKIKICVRDTDFVVRYGGDEFVALLAPCDLETGKRVAERIRKTIESSEFLKDDGLALKVTVSIGVALYPDHATSKEDVIEAADQAMYCAKNESRNSVFVAKIPRDASSA
jgi:two-component system, cell cycle response regulator